MSPDNPQFEPPPTSSESPSGQSPQEALTAGAAQSATVAPIPTGPPPVENPAWNGWDVLLIAVLWFVTIVVLELSFVLGAHRFLYRHTSLPDLAQRPILMLLPQFLIDGAVAVYLFLLVEGKYHVRFWNAIRWNWPRAEWKLLGIGALMLFALSMAESFLPMPKDAPFEKLFARPRDAYLLAIMAVSLGPLVEELFFRGFFYPVLARRWGARWGIILTALPFAAMHMPQYAYAWGALLAIFTVGVVCGTVRAVTRSVGASFLVHVGYNGTQMLIAVIATRGFQHMEKAVFLTRS